ncbi:MAG TPA: cysteine desulfurase [Acidobacteriota bacterium]
MQQVTPKAQATPLKTPLDVTRIREDFPILRRRVHGKRLVYLDNAATSQKPQAVIDAISHYYSHSNANVHRGVHSLAEEATDAYEQVRGKVCRFLNGDEPSSIVFTRNTTESINLVAHSWARKHLGPGDEVVLTVMEHHSNLVPWQMMAKDTGCTLRFIDIDDEGHLRLDHLDDYITRKTRLVCLGHVSNALGTIHSVRTIACAARAVGALVLVDGAQGAPHGPVDVQRLDVDFYAYSPHKALGPLGIGVLWARRDLLEDMDPFLGGGEMIRNVTLERSTWAGVPHKFEAGTPSVADAVGLGAATDYLTEVGMHNIRAHEKYVVTYAMERLAELPFIRIFGPRDPADRCGLVSFVDKDIHPHDLGTVVDQHGVAIRAGHHCAKPLMHRLGVVATARASFYIYNDHDDVDALIDALIAAREVFGLSASR